MKPIKPIKPIAILLTALCITIVACTTTNSKKVDSSDIVIENEQVRLIIGSNGIAKSLVYKPTNEECLEQGENISVFSVTQERTFHNEIKLNRSSCDLQVI